MKIFILFTIFILTGCTNKIFTNYSSNSLIYDKIYKICEKNGGIDKIELVKNEDFNYFFCKKQGFLQVNKIGDLKTVKRRSDKDFIEIDEKTFLHCKEKCQENQYDITFYSEKEYNCKCK